MGISYRGGITAGSSGQGGGSVAINSGLAGGSGTAALAGDLVVVTVSVGTAGRQPTIAIATPSGYTPLTVQRTTASSVDTNVQTCYKIMGATPDTAVTIPASGNNADGIAYAIQVFDGVDPVTPMDVAATFATDSGTDNLPDGAAITPTTPGAWVVVCGGGAAGAGGTYTAAALTAFITSNGADNNDGNVGCGYAVWTSGEYNPAKFAGGSVNSANSWGCSTLALRPMAHPTTGVLSGQGSEIDGTAAHIAKHAATGVLAGPGSAVVGTAAHIAIHQTSGVLAGPGSDVDGTAARTRQHATDGTLSGPGTVVDGTAAHIAIHGTAGVLSGAGAVVDGEASRTGAEGVTHETSGVLSGQGASVSGTANRGFLSGGYWRLPQPKPRIHDADGALYGIGAMVSGIAWRSPAPNRSRRVRDNELMKIEGAP